MSAKQKDAKALVRSLITEGMVEKNIGKQISHGGEQIHISKENGAIRFDLIGMRTAFVLMSGRLYQREFVEPATEPNGFSEGQPIQTQLNYYGLAEEVDTRIFKNKLVCECGNVRWVKNADLFQVKKCKPCTYKERKERRKERRARR
jgi:hypothetical protein